MSAPSRPDSAPAEARIDASGGAPDPETIRAEVAELIGQVVGEEYLLDIEIDMETTFNDDLELESLEFVALAEKVVERYGERVDLVGWFGELDLDSIIDLTVGELVTFIHECLSEPA